MKELEKMNFESYKQSGIAEYKALAAKVASILQNNINDYPLKKFRLQYIAYREKDPESLYKKLEKTGITSTEFLENEIKDLAGCRLIFYSNSDVSRFFQSGIISDNFEIDFERTKIHHPIPRETDPSNQFRADNYVVKLKEGKTEKSEYVRLKDLMCEVQVQTILNHAWSEMTHNIIYKETISDGFGSENYKAIKKRLIKIMENYLLPAGYEFQKSLDDYDRLLEGKELFDHGYLKALEECNNNTERYEVLERFRDYITEYLDSPQNGYLEIKEHLVKMIKIARLYPPHLIETPFGNYPGKSNEDLLRMVASIFKQFRYVNVDITFDGVTELYKDAANEREQKILLEISKSLAELNLDVLKQVGPHIQILLVQKIDALIKAGMATYLRAIFLEILEEVLKVDFSWQTITLKRMTVSQYLIPASSDLEHMRIKTIRLLFELYLTASSETEKRNTINALLSATQIPSVRGFPSEMVDYILKNSIMVVEFFSKMHNMNCMKSYNCLNQDFFGYTSTVNAAEANQRKFPMRH